MSVNLMKNIELFERGLQRPVDLEIGKTFHIIKRVITAENLLCTRSGVSGRKFGLCKASGGGETRS